MRLSFERKSLTSLAICATTLLGTGVLMPVPASAQKAAKGQAALSRLVVVGDSLSAGFQNFSLFTSATGGQTFGFAAVIAQQAGVNLTLPTISYPGIPPELMLSGGQVVRAAGLGSRTNPAQATNLSVPGFTVGNTLVYPYPGNPSPTNTIDLLSDTILGTPQDRFTCGPLPTALIDFLPLPSSISSLIPKGSPFIVSQAACAVALLPSTVIVSIGSNDVLQALTLGVAPTPVSVFQSNYQLLLDALSITRANIVVSNVPDVTSVPFVVNATAFEAQCHASIPAGYSYVVPNLGAPTFNVCTENIPLTQAQITGLQQLVIAYNGIIAAEVANLRAHGGSATVVDLNGLLKTLSTSGYQVSFGSPATTHLLTTAYLGGLFSLDGIHPTNTGYGILANTFINSINTLLGTQVPLVSIPKIAAKDPLIF
jgi:lysophospholipase L1-like esterase